MAFAVTWGTAPKAFRLAAQELGLRVTQVCRPQNANYGAKNSLHKRCLAMDLGKETSQSTINSLRQYGLCGQFHRKGYFGATGDHWHVVQCSTGQSQNKAREQQRTRVKEIRSRNTGKTNKISVKKRAPKVQQSYEQYSSPLDEPFGVR